VRLGALIALDASQSSFQWNAVDGARVGRDGRRDRRRADRRRADGGLARVASAAPAVALALGYDIDAALEAHDEGERPSRGTR
jgi:hypothetical protein